ncbi:uncharacterized protein [Palaemon carinicauda]|uniref:uncharacterized protein n=1 Tax=Palaemon carinicauda TaxID=392227 RepID=UPI0035B5E6F3
MGITVHQTTAYNLAANKMVKCFHCTLKAALISSCKDSNWFTQLSWGLLGLRTTPKDAMDVSVAEMTYKPPAEHHKLTDLHSATRVLLYNDTSKPPLILPYTGPLFVIQRNPKAFLLNIHGKNDCVSIDRLKPAYHRPDDQPEVRLCRSRRPI